MRRILAVVAVLISSVIMGTGAVLADWQQPDGPYGGPSMSVAISDDGTLYKGNWGPPEGIFRSIDGGNTWVRKLNKEVKDIEIDAQGRVFVATTDGIYRSLDHGENFAEADTGLIYRYVHCISISPSGIVYAGTDNGSVFKSDDFGDHWNRKIVGSTAESISSLGIKPDETIFAGANQYGHVYRSVDGGETWLPIRTGNPREIVEAIAVDYDGRVFVSGEPYGILKTEDDGNKWDTLRVVGNGLMKSIAIARNGDIFAGEQGTYRSTDHGANWFDVHNGMICWGAVSISINSNDVIFAGTWGGVYLSEDRGEKWRHLKMMHAGIWDIKPGAHTDLYTIVANNSVARSTDSGNTWFYPIDTNPGILMNITARTVTSTLAGAIVKANDWTIARSEDSGVSWTQADISLPSGEFRDARALFLARDGYLLAGGSIQDGSAYPGILRSDDDGINWYKIGDIADGYCVISIAMGPDGSLYAGVLDDQEKTSGTLFRSTDAGAHWQRLPISFPQVYGLPCVPIAFDGSGHVFAASSGGGISRSSDGGSTWEPANNGLVNTEILSLAGDSDGHVFAGATHGRVYVTIDSGENWILVGQGLVDTEIISLLVYQNTLFAGSGTFGLWKRPLSEMCENLSRPPVPNNLTVYPGNAQVELRWDLIQDPDIIRYRIYGGVSQDPMTLIKEIAAVQDLHSTIITGLNNGISYYFRITSVDRWMQESDFSNEVTSTLVESNLTAPFNLTVMQMGEGQVMLSWDANTEPDVLKYFIYSDTHPDPTTRIDSTDAGVSGTTRAIAGLTNGITYFFRVTAMDLARNESGFSNEVSIIPGNIPEDGPPVISDVNVDPSLVEAGSSVAFSAIVTDDRTSVQSVSAEIKLMDGSSVVSFPLFDDGGHADGQAGDNRYGNVWTTPDIDAEYAVDISATDDQGYSVSLPNVRSLRTVRFSKPVLDVSRAGRPPVIDGQMDGIWAEVAANGGFYSLSGLPPVESAEDCNPEFRVMWDDTCLYYYCHLVDNSLINDNNGEWYDDSFEIYSDGGNSRGSVYDGVDDVQFRFPWNQQSLFVSDWGAGMDVSGFRYAQKDTLGGWSLEASLRLDAIRLNAVAGQAFSLDVHYNDDDDGDQREHKMGWWQTSDEGWRNPSVFGKARLSDTVVCDPDTRPPSITSLTVPMEPIRVGATVDAGAEFTDQGGSHTAVWNWGDDSTSVGIVSEIDGSGIVAGVHAYQAAGVYTITLYMTDQSGNASEAIFQYAVVFNPDAGFVTGAGWIQSPPGAYAPDPSLTGRAHFGFVSKYQKGATVPSGETQFQFKTAGLIFKSTEYDWMVISGGKAKYKGSGSINSSGDYGFMLTAMDGQWKDGTGTDCFRIKIWSKDASETVVYDNQMGESDDSDAGTGLGGGNIIVHSQALAKGSRGEWLDETIDIPQNFDLCRNYPNPFNPSTTIRFGIPEACEVRIDILSVDGRQVAVINDGPMKEGYHAIPFAGKDDSGRTLPAGVYLCRMTAGNQIRVMRMLLLK